MSDISQNKNSSTPEPDASGINLLPDALRQEENKELMSKDAVAGPVLRVPKPDNKKLPEGKVPWFSFSSWFGKDKKKSTEPIDQEPDDDKKPKLLFKVLKSKDDFQAQEQAKEEIWKQQIINDVFTKSGKELPANDNALFNQAKKIDMTPVSPEVAPVVDVTPPTPAVMKSADQTAPISYEAIDTSLPRPPAETTPVMPVMPVLSIEPVTPTIPSIPAPMSEALPEPTSPKKHGFHLPAWHLGGHQAQSDKKDAADGFQVNLIPTALTVKSWTQISQRLLMSAVGAVIVAAIVYGGLMLWEWQIESKAKEIDKQIAQVEASINQFQALKDEIAKTETQIKDVQQLLSRHVYWTKFFALLQKYSIDTVSYDRFAAGTNGSMSLNARGTDYQSAARQLKLLQMPEAQEFVKDASITTVTQDEKGGVSFTINLTLNNNLFYYASSTSSK